MARQLGVLNSQGGPSASADARAVALWLIACAAMIAAMMVLGGITRLTESGLSITEWRPVYGAIPPLSEAAWQAEFAKYREIPQFALLHSWMTLDDFKSIYFWEWLHRLWGRLIGVVFAVPLLVLWWRGRIAPAVLPRLVGILLLGGLQGALGWFMVKSGLADRVEVSQYRLVAHLGLAVLIYAAILRVALGLLLPRPGTARPAAPWLGRAATALCGLVFVTLLAGGFVAGLNAGLTYNTFPLMDGRFFPTGYFQLAPWWRNLFENVAAVQFDHRLLAITTFAAVVALWGAGRGVTTGGDRRALDILLGLALAQVSLGIATLLLVVPLPLAVLHQAGALALFTAALVVQYRLRAAVRTAAVPGRRLDEQPAALL